MIKKMDKYVKCLLQAESANWKLDELLPSDFEISFSKPFLAQEMTFENSLEFLTTNEKLDLNHIRGVSYLNIFGFVEEYIASLMISIAAQNTFSENERLRALLKFAEEEVKHQILFERYVNIFNKKFKTKCEFLDNSGEVANIILSNSELGVLLTTLHFELITQDHYLKNIKNTLEIDSKFQEILHKHWLEEVQHSKLDLYEMQNQVEKLGPEEVELAFGEYFSILNTFINLLKRQVSMDFDSLKRCSSRNWSSYEISQFQNSQLSSYINIFVLDGFENQSFKKNLTEIFGKSVVERIDLRSLEIRKQYKLPPNGVEGAA